MPYKKSLSKREKIRRGAYVFFFSLIVGVIGAIIFMIVEPGGGPRGPVASDREAVAPEERQALMEESRRLEARFRGMVSDEEPPGEDAVATLRQAYENQRRALANHLAAAADERDRLQQLRRDLDEYESHFLARQVQDLRREAQEKRAEGDYESGILLLEDALEIQERINREMRGSSHASTAAVSSLSRDIVNWRAEPLIRLSRESEERARTAVREQRWADALDEFTDARDAQALINEDFPRTPFVNRARVSSLDAEISDLRTQEIRAGIASHREEGARLLDDGAFHEAAERFEEAARLQRELNREFPGSRFASSSALRELETERQTALSGELHGELNAALDALETSLRAWQADEALNHLNIALETSERMRSDFPLSEFNDETLAFRITYLDSLRGSLGALLGEIRENLRAIPGHDGVSLYATETPQDLFRAIMNRNPSRQAGDRLPVDSVNWDEAVEFCSRLSWVLAREVRLPSREEFFAAAAENEAGAGLAWHLPNSTGESRPVGTRDPNEYGFHDLWGNVAEWLQPAADRRAPVAGGSYDNDLEDLTDPPLRQADTHQRSRAIGFRFAVVTGEG